MIILIDGYNLLKRVKGPSISEKDRMAFATLLSKYNKYKGHTIIIVFDGGVDKFQEHVRHHGIDIIYAGNITTADEVIIKKNREYGAREMVVVTADNGIINLLKGQNTTAIDPIVFYDKIIKNKEKSAQASYLQDFIKWSSVDNEQLDNLMQETAVFHKDGKGQAETTRISSGNIASKAERAYHRKIKKI